MQQLPYPQPTSKDCQRWREKTGILRVREKGCEVIIDKKIGRKIKINT